MEEKYQLLEETGHSYSGISDIVFNRPAEVYELLYQIDDNYNELVKRQEELERELHKVKTDRAYLVSDFIYLHKALKLKEEPISFVRDGFYTEVKVSYHDDNETINYEKKKVTL